MNHLFRSKPMRKGCVYETAVEITESWREPPYTTLYYNFLQSVAHGLFFSLNTSLPNRLVIAEVLKSQRFSLRRFLQSHTNCGCRLVYILFITKKKTTWESIISNWNMAHRISQNLSKTMGGPSSRSRMNRSGSTALAVCIHSSSMIFSRRSSWFLDAYLSLPASKTSQRDARKL